MVPIEDDVLAQRVVARVLDSGVSVVRRPAMCLIEQCRQSVVRERLYSHCLLEYEAAQEQRLRRGLTELDPRAWAEAQRRSRKRH